MKAGKLSEAALKRSVLKQLHSENKNVVLGAAYGRDACAIATDETQIVFSTEPVLVTDETQGMLAIARVLNNVAATGAVPAAVLTDILLPTSSNENELRAIIKAMDEACIKADVQIIGGHTQVTRVVNAPVITATGVGICNTKKIIDSSMVEPGMDILVTKWVGMEGSALLAKKMQKDLLSRYTVPFLDKACALLEGIMAYPEAAVAAKSGVCAMHDVEEGGIFAALWEMAEASGVGLEIDLKAIPIRQETVEICEFFDINPYKLLSGGCMLMATRDGNALKLALQNAGIQAAIIGKATDCNERVLLTDGEKRFLETAQTDEIYKVKELLN